MRKQFCFTWPHYFADRVRVCNGPRGIISCQTANDYKSCLREAVRTSCEISTTKTLFHLFQMTFTKSKKKPKKPKTTAPVELTFITSSSGRGISAFRACSSSHDNCVSTHRETNNRTEEITQKCINVYSEQRSFTLLGMILK